MPQLVLLGAIGCAAYFGYRAVNRLRSERRASSDQTTGESPVEPRSLGTLERDPKTGIYRPRQ